MISRTPGWSWNVDAGVVTLAPRGDLRCGRVRYRERVQPLRSVDEILAARIEDGTFAVASIGRADRFTTDEGEHAAIVTSRGTHNDAPCTRTVGVVLADDWYSEIDALALRADQFDAFARIARTLVQQDRLMLGVRRRRVLHDAPRGFVHDEPLPMFARYRRGDETIVVYSALPAPAGAPDGFDLLACGPPEPATMLRSLAPRAPLFFGRLAGTVWEFEIRDARERQLARRIAMLRDERYVYTAYLDAPLSALAARRSLLHDVLASIEPFPTPVRSSQPLELFGGLY